MILYAPIEGDNGVYYYHKIELPHYDSHSAVLSILNSILLQLTPNIIVLYYE